MLGAHEQHRSGTVGLGAAVEQVERVAHGRRRQHVVDRDLVLEVRVRVAGAVVVVLDGDRREHLARRAVLVHVTCRERREQHRRRLAAREDRVAGGGAREEPFLGRLVAHLLDADDEHDVVDAAGDGHRADAERVGAGRARVLDAGARDAGEADRRRDGVAADALLAPERAALRGDERGFDLRRLEALVDAVDCGGERAGRHLLVALLEELPELDEPAADDRDPVPAHVVLPRLDRPRPRLVAVHGDAALVRVAPQHELDLAPDLESAAVADDLQHHARAVLEVDDASGSGATNGAGIVWLTTNVCTRPRRASASSTNFELPQRCSAGGSTEAC